MNNIDNEQWKHGGDCSKCRRNTYCTKSCTVQKRKRQTFIKDAVRSVLNNATGGVLHEHIDKVFDTF